MEDPNAWSRHTQVRGLLGGTGQQCVYSAVGIPIQGWQDHLLGAELTKVTRWHSACYRATVKPYYNPNDKFIGRYGQARDFFAQLRRQNPDLVEAIWMDGFQIRVMIKQRFTQLHKDFFAAANWIEKVHADAAVAPGPVRVGNEPTTDELEHAAQVDIRPGESAVIASITGDRILKAPANQVWQAIAQQYGWRIVAANTLGCVFAGKGDLERFDDAQIGLVSLSVG